MKKFEYHQPESLKEAYEWMDKFDGRARYIAGGTDILVRIKQRNIEPDALISLRGIEELKGMNLNGDLTLGSMALLRDIERSQEIAQHFAALAQAVGWLANPQVRNVATVGGNLCNAAPSADSAPPLMVMEAMLTLEGPGGKREISIEEFFTGPGETCMYPVEVLKEIKVPQMQEGAETAFQKAGRVAKDLAIVNAAALIKMNGKKCATCRLAVGAVAPVPLRLKKVEAIIEDEEITQELLDHVTKLTEQEVNPITDVRATEAYRRTLSGVLVKRAIVQALQA